jgi:hypothetical protein
MFNIVTAVHQLVWMLKSISSSLPFPNKLTILGRKYTPAVPQNLSISPIIIGLSQYFTPTSWVVPIFLPNSPQIKGEFWLSQYVVLGCGYWGTVKASPNNL